MTGRREGPGTDRNRGPARPLRRLARHAGALIGVAALCALTLGIVGYRAFVPGAGFAEYLYRSLQLFIVQIDSSGAPSPLEIPVTLEVARFLAPVAGAAASIRAVLALFGEKATRAWVRFFVRDHVVVCGLAPVGARLAVAFREAGHRVVAIEPDGSGSAVHDSRARGVIVLVGDPTDRGLLVKAGVVTARYLIVASGDDGRNADVALAARDVVGARRRPLPCFVHVVHPGLSGLLVESTLVAGAGGSLRLEFFNPWDAVPPMVLDEFPPAGAGGPPAGTVPHMLVVGPGRLGRELVTHAARRRAGDAAGAGGRLRVTLAGSGAAEVVDDLCRRYPRLEEVCDLRAAEVGVESSEFEQGTFLEGGGDGVASAYVALEDDASGLQAALTLSRAVPDARVVVLTTEHSGLATLVSGIRPESSPIELFDVLERGGRPEILLDGTIELLAQAIHGDYVRAQQAAGRTPADNPSMRGWDDLPEATRDSNRAQAADVGNKLAAVGCRVRPWTDWTGEGFTFRAAEVERMAELEHERWCQDRAADGWTYGATRDDRRKTTPYLVPWDQLTEEVKDLDRSAVRALPELLTYAGFEIVRLRPGPESP